jgi:hypothetical protein
MDARDDLRDDRREDPAQKKRPRLGPAERQYLLTHLLRMPALFAAARGRLRPADLLDVDRAFAACWQAALAVADRSGGRLPEPPAAARLVVEAETHKAVEGDPTTFGPVSDQVLGTPGVRGLLDTAYAVEATALSEPHARGYLALLLEEVTVYRRLHRYVEDWEGWVPEDLDPFLEQLNAQRLAVAGLTTSAALDPFPGYYVLPDSGCFTTGVGFLDRLMDGGQAPGEVYVLLGATKSGKTTLGVKLAVEGARHQQLVARASGGRPADWLYFGYEEVVRPLMHHRVWSYAAVIDGHTFRHNLPLSSLERGDYKDYERARWAGAFARGLPVAGEAERLEAARAELGGKNLVLVDFAGGVEGQGLGGIDEIARTVALHAQEGRRTSGVVTDYAGLAVERMIMGRNLDPKQEFRHLERFVNEIRVKVAAPYRCAVWVLHQLHGDEAKRSPGARLHHTNARGSRNIADNAAFAFALGNIDPSSNCLVVNCTARRRPPGRGRPRHGGGRRRLRHRPGHAAHRAPRLPGARPGPGRPAPARPGAAGAVPGDGFRTLTCSRRRRPWHPSGASAGGPAATTTACPAGRSARRSTTSARSRSTRRPGPSGRSTTTPSPGSRPASASACTAGACCAAPPSSPPDEAPRRRVATQIACQSDPSRRDTCATAAPREWAGRREGRVGDRPPRAACPRRGLAASGAPSGGGACAPAGRGTAWRTRGAAAPPLSPPAFTAGA